MQTFIAICTIVSSLYGSGGPPTPVPDSVRLHVVFPIAGDTLDFDRVRYAGAALPGATVSVQGQATLVYQSGAFVGMVDLHDGHNRIVFSARDSQGTVTDTVTVFRAPKRTSYPESPTAIDPATIRPSHDVFILPGEVLEVTFQGSPNGQAWFSIDSVVSRVKVSEAAPKRAGGLRGVYGGKVKVPRHVETTTPKPVMFDFQGRDGYGFQFNSAGKVRVLSPHAPVIGMTRDSTNLVLDEPDGDIFMELPPGLRLQVVGLREHVYKIRLSSRVKGYIRQGSLDLLPDGSRYPYAAIENVAIAEDTGWTHLTVDVTERAPFRVRQPKSSVLELSFFRAVRSPQWVMHPPGDGAIKAIRARQKNSDVFVFRLELNQKRQWGYRAGYAGKQFRISIRKAPVRSGGLPLTGLTIAVDAGHGGESEGGTTATGLLEKDLTLNLARNVQQGLDTSGATVIMTRSADTTVALQSRIETARASGAHIFVSLHFNSIGPDVAPLQPRGSSVYFTVPQSQTLARLLQDRLATLPLPPYGLKTAPFLVTRQTDMLAILVEGAFLTHPEDEMLLLREGFVGEMADAIVAGLRDFVVENVRPVTNLPSASSSQLE